MSLNQKNLALLELNKNKSSFSWSYVQDKATTESVANGEQNPNDTEIDWRKFFAKDDNEKKTYLIALGVSLGLIILFILAVKYKLIRL